MQLIKFKGSHGSHIFVNPKMITFICPAMVEGKPTNTTIITFADEQNWIEIFQPIGEVIRKLSRSKNNS